MKQFHIKKYFIIASIFIAATFLYLDFSKNPENDKSLNHELITIELGDEHKIAITLPKCNQRASEKRYMTARGLWRFTANELFLDCADSEHSIGFFAISQIKKNGMATIMPKNTNHRLIEENGNYKKYRYGWGGTESYEAIVFPGADGNAVYIDYPISDPTVLTIHRNINDWFEIELHMNTSHSNQDDLLNIDKSIYAYVKKLISP